MTSNTVLDEVFGHRDKEEEIIYRTVFQVVAGDLLMSYEISLMSDMK